MKRSLESRSYDDGFWFTIFHPFVCPACDGEGGYYGQGLEPDEPCNFCKDRGYVGLWAKMLSMNGWFLEGTIGNIRYAIRRWKERKEVKP